MAAPLVSVIIPVYNGEDCIARALDSVLAQDFTDYEVLVVDDGSRDSTRRILRRYRRRIRIIRLPRNLGLAAARNRGVARAQGRYIAFLDADDVWMPGRLARTVAPLQASKTATLSFSDVVPVDDRYTPLAPSYLHPGMARPPMLTDLLKEGWWPILPSTVTVQRRALRRVRGFAEGFQGASGFEDTEVWFRLRELGDFIFVPEPLVQYRLSPFVERMRKYAPGFRLFARRIRKRYGLAGEKLILRCAALYRWLLTVKGLQCLQAGDMRQARNALFCALRYQAAPGRRMRRDERRRARFVSARAANNLAPAAGKIAAGAGVCAAEGPALGGGVAASAEPATPALVAKNMNNGVRSFPQRREETLRAWYSLLPRRHAIALMRRSGLLEIPPPPPSHADFARELLAGAHPLALY